MKNISSYIPLMLRLRGQSNAIGVNRIAGNLPTGLTGVQNGRKIFVSGLWQTLLAGTNNAGDDIGGAGFFGYYGIEMKLMSLLYDWTKNDIWMMKFGHGGIQLEQQAGINNDWSPSSTGSDYYPQSQSYYVAAKNKFPYGYNLIDIWIQGENDANSSLSGLYQNNQSNLILTDRTNHGKGYSPFIMVGLSPFQTALDGAQINIINNAKKAVASIIYESGVFTTKSGLPNVMYIGHSSPVNSRFINLDGSDGGADNVHYTEIGLNNIAGLCFEGIKYFIN